MFGCFVNLTPLRLRCDPARTFREWLPVMRKIVGETQARSGIHYEQLCGELRKRGVNPPEVGVIFSMSEHNAPLHFGGLELTWLNQHIENMPWGFNLVFDPHNEEHQCHAAFDARIYNPARVRVWLRRFMRFLDAASRSSDLSIGQLLAMSKKAV